VNDAGLGHDHDEPVALALVRPHDDLERGRIEKRAAAKVDHEEPVGPQIGLCAFYGGFKIFCIRNIELAENMQCDNGVEILANKSRALIRNDAPTFRPLVWTAAEQHASCDLKRDAV
jgi:hypothetical protein